MILETLFPMITIGAIKIQYVFIYCSELRYFYISTKYCLFKLRLYFHSDKRNSLILKMTKV